MQAKSIMAKVAAANIVPHSFTPNSENNEELHKEIEKYHQQQEQGIVDIETPTVDTPPALTPEKKKLLFSKIDLLGTKD